MQKQGLLQFRSIVCASQINYDGVYNKGVCNTNLALLIQGFYSFTQNLCVSGELCC